MFIRGDIKNRIVGLVDGESEPKERYFGYLNVGDAVDRYSDRVLKVGVYKEQFLSVQITKNI